MKKWYPNEGGMKIQKAIQENGGGDKGITNNLDEATSPYTPMVLQCIFITY